MIRPSVFPPDLERVALAVDSLCVGSPDPILIHAESEPLRSGDVASSALFFTPLPELTSLNETIRVLSAVTVPDDWRLAGLCAPTTIRVPLTEPSPAVRMPGWIVHVVSPSGSSASRLCIPQALELSGPTTSIDEEHALHRCLCGLLHAATAPPHRRK